MHAGSTLFLASFGMAPALTASAPGRVNIIGEHVDYCGGFVLPVATPVRAAAAASPRPDRSVRIVSRERPGAPLGFALDAPYPAAAPAWGAYIFGVLSELIAEGVPVPGLDLAIASQVPMGAGLSSSAALEVAVARAALAAAGASLPPLALARACQRAEHRHAGVPCGLMDQLTSATDRPGEALLIDCHTLSIDPIPAPALIAADTGVKHDLAAGAYADRRRECESALARLNAAGLARPTLRHATPSDLSRAPLTAVELKRARHVVSECRRTLDTAEALRRADLRAAGHLMNRSHASLRDDFEVSCPELDDLADRARALPGVLGARMTGGGFGGCIVALVEPAAADSVAAALGPRAWVISRGRRVGD